jgi:hypothetical protein
VKGIIHEPGAKPTMKPESRNALLTAIAKARGWIDDIRLGPSPPSLKSPRGRPLEGPDMPPKKPQQTVYASKFDIRVRAPFSKGAWRHTQDMCGIGVKTAAEIESRIVDSFGHGFALSQLLANAFLTMGSRVGLRCNAGNDLEDPMKVITA